MSDRRHNPAYNHLFMALALALLLIAVAMPARAQIESVYEVSGVKVDITADSAAAAREQALAEGQVLAFNQLLDRLVLALDRDRLPVYDSEETARFVRNFSVSSEKTSPIRYLASLTYRFQPEAVRRLLMDSGVAFTETPSKPVLVLPVYRSAGALYLWDEPNPWLEAWRSLPQQDGLVPMVLPLGDLTDIAAVGSEQAAAGDLPRLAAAATRYGASDSLVAIASTNIDPVGGAARVEINVTRYGSSLDAQTLVLTYLAEPGEELPTLLIRAAESLSREIQSAWKRDNRIEFGQGTVLAVTVPVTSLSDWQSVRTRLARVAIIEDVELVLLSRSEVLVLLHYLGDPIQLVTALEQADLQLVEREGESILSLAGSPSARTPPATRALP